ncbi:hypothetical protein N7475_003305, partial [Penicillium sp. IBT 31633x]
PRRGGKSLIHAAPITVSKPKFYLILDPNIDKTTLDKVYGRIARYMPQPFQLHARIGAISKDHALDT